MDTEISSSGHVLTVEQSTEYYTIWKQLLLAKSDMSEAYFNEHVTDYALSSSEWQGGISFTVQYIMHVEWIDVKCQDKFLVKMNESYSAYEHLDIARDVFFNADQIQFNMTNGVHSEISFYNTVSELKYANCVEVYTALDKSGIVADQISYYVPGKFPKEDGDPYYLLGGPICGSKNKCWQGYINLVTGEQKTWEDVCIIVD